MHSPLERGKILTPAPLFRLPEVLRLFGGLSQSSWYSGVKKGIYPRPIKIGPRAVAWRYADLEPLLANGLDGGRDDAN